MGEERPDTGGCVNCAFLAFQSDERFAVGEPMEIGKERRRSGKVYLLHIAGTGGKQLVEPVCVRDRANFREEIGDPNAIRAADLRKDAEAHYQRACEAFAHDRKCDDWREHKPGVSPNMALEFTMFEQLERDRRAWEEKLDERNAKRDRKANAVIVFIAVVGLLFSAATIFAALAAITPNSLGGSWFGLHDKSAPLPASEPTVREPPTDDEPHSPIEP